MAPFENAVGPDMEVKVVSSQQRWIVFLVMFATFASCDGRLIAAGNLGLAVVPCILLWVTVNLKKSR